MRRRLRSAATMPVAAIDLAAAPLFRARIVRSSGRRQPPALFHAAPHHLRRRLNLSCDRARARRDLYEAFAERHCRRRCPSRGCNTAIMRSGSRSISAQPSGPLPDRSTGAATLADAPAKLELARGPPAPGTCPRMPGSMENLPHPARELIDGAETRLAGRQGVDALHDASRRLSPPCSTATLARKTSSWAGSPICAGAPSSIASSATSSIPSRCARDRPSDRDAVQRACCEQVRDYGPLGRSPPREAPFDEVVRRARTCGATPGAHPLVQPSCSRSSRQSIRSPTGGT